MIIDDRRNSWSNIGKTNYDSTERRFNDEARYDIISVRRLQGQTWLPQ